jgi:ABC-type uncharacterized transport system permease subunit
MRMRHIVIVACLAVQHFSTVSHKQQDFTHKNAFERYVCFYFLYNFCLNYFSFWEELSEILLKMCIDIHVQD